MKKVLASMAAAGVLVTGAFVASAITDGPASAQVPDTTVADDAAPGDPGMAGPLEEVLDGLVADGTLSQAQADEVESRLRAAHEERSEVRMERREERRADRQQIREFLEDDVIDGDELAQLGDDHPFNDPDGPFADAASDGQITREELRELRDAHRAEREAAAGNATGNAGIDA
jgi:hypothetical protein